MLRAFAVLSLSLFAACVSSSHAGPAARQQPAAGYAASSPEDPYGEAAFVPGQTCEPGANCSFDCNQGGCTFFCAEGSTCNIECDGGGCRTACAPGATCNVECDGGRCGTGCGDGATCNVACDGGSCAHACAPDATCHLECDGGNCT